jgi:hypothetical protein
MSSNIDSTKNIDSDNNHGRINILNRATDTAVSVNGSSANGTPASNPEQAHRIAPPGNNLLRTIKDNSDFISGKEISKNR